MKKKNLEDDDDESESFDRSHMGTRYRKTNLFNNYNKRQVSHLPFIKMTDGAKIQESHRSSQGKSQQKVTLKSFI